MGEGAGLYELQRHLDPLTRVAATAFGAPACSIALVQGGALTFVSVHGRGSDILLGVGLPVGHGIAGLVAASGQSLEVSDVASDPRFAREVADTTGYVPETLLAVPIVDLDGDTSGVLSVLDRDRERLGQSRAMELAAGIAAVAASIIELARDERDEPDLADAMRRRIQARSLASREESLVTGLAGLLASYLLDEDFVP